MKQRALELVDARLQSHPARGAWIETELVTVKNTIPDVAPREGCVD